MNTIVITGHRPNEIGGYKTPNSTYDFIFTSTIEVYEKLKPTKIISGGALGFDQLAVRAAIQLQIPFEMYVPFLGQENIWPQKSKDEYHELLAKASNVVICCKGGFSSEKMQIRNCMMVDQLLNNEDRLLSCWNGKQSGGTYNCLQYALKQKKKIIRIDPLLKTIAYE